MASLIDVMGTQEGGAVSVSPVKYKVKSGTAASISAGFLVIDDGSNQGYVKAAPDTCDTDSTVKGVAAAPSTETASADGEVTLFCAPTMRVRVKAKTPGDLVASMRTQKFILDVTSGSYYLDQATTTKGLFELEDYDNTTDGNCIALIRCV